MLYAFLVFCLVGSACAKLSQSFEDGCPDLEVEPAFDISKVSSLVNSLKDLQIAFNKI